MLAGICTECTSKLPVCSKYLRKEWPGKYHQCFQFKRGFIEHTTAQSVLITVKKELQKKQGDEDTDSLII